MECILEAESLVKRFKGVTAVNGVDISVRRGEIFGFLGPNGAGKTTTIRMLTTISRPTSGTVRIDGMLASENLREARGRIGVVQQQISLDKDISVRHNIVHHAMMHKIPRREIGPKMDRLSEMMGLTQYLDHDVTALSGGWRRKAAIVCALMHDPELLFLDEPTAGLDSQSRHALWDMMRMLNGKGTTIFLTTHYIEEAESLCDRVAIIDRGRIRRLGSPGEICDSIGRVTLEFEGEDRSMQYRFFPDRESARTFAAGLDGRNPRMRRTVLEDAFLEITGRKSPDDSAKAVRAPR